MNKDNITLKAFDTIRSCKTPEQLNTATKYCGLVLKRLPFATFDEMDDLKILFEEHISKQAVEINK